MDKQQEKNIIKEAGNKNKNNKNEIKKRDYMKPKTASLERLIKLESLW